MITKNSIVKALRDGVFTPSKPGPLRIVIDVGDSDYYLKRAKEFLFLAENSPTQEQKHRYLNNALSLIALVKVTDETRTNNKI